MYIVNEITEAAEFTLKGCNNEIYFY